MVIMNTHNEQIERKRKKAILRRIIHSVLWGMASIGVSIYIFTVTNDVFVTSWAILVLIAWTVIFLWRSVGIDKRLHAIFGRFPKWLDMSNGDYRDDCTTFHRETATIAYDLIPHLDKFLDHSCKLVVTGNDCHATIIPEYPWRDFLESCLKDKGCHIIQYVSHGSHDADSFLWNLEKKYPEQFDRRQFVDPDLVEDQKDRELIKTLEVLHPTLAWNEETGERVLWIERYHPNKSEFAYGCDFYDAKAIERDSRGFEFFRERLERAWTVTRDSSPTKGSPSG